jgi:hypothetical protein
VRTNIGKYPDTSLADARKEARKLLVEEPTKADRIRFDDAYEFFKEAQRSGRSTTTSESWKNTFSQNSGPRSLAKFRTKTSSKSLIGSPAERSEIRLLSLARFFAGAYGRLGGI